MIVLHLKPILFVYNAKYYLQINVNKKRYIFFDAK